MTKPATWFKILKANGMVVGAFTTRLFALRYAEPGDRIVAYNAITGEEL